MKNEKAPMSLKKSLTGQFLGLEKASPSSLSLYKGKEDHRKEKTGETEATSWGCNMARTSQVDDGGLH